MDPTQFQTFTLGLAQQDAERRDQLTMRELVKDLIKQTATCDGTTTGGVRTWMREVTLALNQVGPAFIIHVASRSCAGPLRYELERFIENVMITTHVDRHAIHWADLRTHIAGQFLEIDEQASLRDDLERIRQSAYEPTSQYARRFREACDVAYVPALRNPDQERVLLRTFARGLTSDTLARKLIEQSNPTSIEEAITAVTRYCERSEAYSRLGREEQPMEISVASPLPSTEDRPLIKMIDSLSSTVERLATKIAKLEVGDRGQRKGNGRKENHNRDGRDGRDNRDGRDGRDGRDRRDGRDGRDGRQGTFHCYNCLKAGHYARDCRSPTKNNPGNERSS